MEMAGAFHYSSPSHDMKDFSELNLAQELSQTERGALEGTQAVWRKLDTRILPLCAGFFFLSFLVCLWSPFLARYAQAQKMCRTEPMSRMRVWLACRHHWRCQITRYAERSRKFGSRLIDL